MSATHTGGCQCGNVRYEVQADINEVFACNCSRCGRLGSRGQGLHRAGSPVSVRGTRPGPCEAAFPPIRAGF